MEQNKTSTMGGNPDIKFPPQTGKAIPYSQDGLINGWKAIPTSGNYIMTVQNGEFSFISIPNENCVVTSQGSVITFLQAPSGDLKLLNNSLGWTATENCT